MTRKIVKLSTFLKTTPQAALRWDTGSISLEMQVAKRKLLFLYHLIEMSENSLANEIYQVQVSKNLPVQQIFNKISQPT